MMTTADELQQALLADLDNALSRTFFVTGDLRRRTETQRMQRAEADAATKERALAIYQSLPPRRSQPVGEVVEGEILSFTLCPGDVSGIEFQVQEEKRSYGRYLSLDTGDKDSHYTVDGFRVSFIGLLNYLATNKMQVKAETVPERYGAAVKAEFATVIRDKVTKP